MTHTLQLNGFCREDNRSMEECVRALEVRMEEVKDEAAVSMQMDEDYIHDLTLRAERAEKQSEYDVGLVRDVVRDGARAIFDRNEQIKKIEAERDQERIWRKAAEDRCAVAIDIMTAVEKVASINKCQHPKDAIRVIGDWTHYPQPGDMSVLPTMLVRECQDCGALHIGSGYYQRNWPGRWADASATGQAKGVPR